MLALLVGDAVCVDVAVPLAEALAVPVAEEVVLGSPVTVGVTGMQVPSVNGGEPQPSCRLRISPPSVPLSSSSLRSHSTRSRPDINRRYVGGWASA